MIKDEVELVIKGHVYSIKFPNVGQYYRIEALKQNLSNGYYNALVMSVSKAAQHALDMIDIEATLVVLCPELIKDLKVKNFNELDIRDYCEIRDAFYKVVAPFFKEIDELLKSEDNTLEQK